MELLIPLVREFGPIIILYFFFNNVGPNMLKNMVDVGASRARVQDHAFEASVSNVTLLLQQNQQERDRNSESEAAMREAIRYLSQELDRLTKIVEALAEQFKGLVSLVQLITGRVDNLTIRVNDMDERLGDYVVSTRDSLRVISDHIVNPTSNINSQENPQ